MDKRHTRLKTTVSTIIVESYHYRIVFFLLRTLKRRQPPRRSAFRRATYASLLLVLYVYPQISQDAQPSFFFPFSKEKKKDISVNVLSVTFVGE